MNEFQGPLSSAPAARSPVSVVLVHGAFENSSSWSKVIAILQKCGVNVVAVQNPATSLAAAVQNTRRVIESQDGAVVLVGHSFGGVVITEAGNDDRVRALVYVAAASPDSGQSGLDEAAAYPKPALLSHLFVDGQGFAYATEQGMRDLAQDLPKAERDILMATQGPIALSAFEDKVTYAAWLDKPVWSVVADNDQAISPQEQTDAALRMKAKVRHVNSSHLVMLSAPEQVAEVILEAYRVVGDGSDRVAPPALSGT
ncbi:MAG: alpha/beta hydrolase [Proteobacteria bacterium]|nr:alpha/beta hydrolase [Pseudomonadota bacterium]